MKIMIFIVFKTMRKRELDRYNAILKSDQEI